MGFVSFHKYGRVEPSREKKIPGEGTIALKLLLLLCRAFPGKVDHVDERIGGRGGEAAGQLRNLGWDVRVERNGKSYYWGLFNVDIELVRSIVRQYHTALSSSFMKWGR